MTKRSTSEPSEPRPERVAAVGVPELLVRQIETICTATGQDVTRYICTAIERALHEDLDAQAGMPVTRREGLPDDEWYAWATHVGGMLGMDVVPGLCLVSPVMNRVASHA